MTDEQPKPRIGRPPKQGTVGPRGGKGFTMTARITGETRAALEAEAERTGRTIGQVAELWLEIARGLDARGGVADAVRNLVRYAKALEGYGLDPDKDSGARETLLTGWAHLLPSALPFAPPSDAEKALGRAIVNFAVTCGQFLAYLDSLPEDHRYRLAAEERPLRGSGLLSASLPSDSLREMIEALSDPTNAARSSARSLMFYRFDAIPDNLAAVDKGGKKLYPNILIDIQTAGLDVSKAEAAVAEEKLEAKKLALELMVTMSLRGVPLKVGPA
jgi:hypothetical protein